MTKRTEKPESVETVLTAPAEPIEELPQDQEPDQTPEQLRPILSDEEIAEIKAAARKQIEAKRKNAAKKSLLERELERLRVEEGMVTGGVMDQMVKIRITLPELAPCLSVNGRPYWHGQEYVVPRHVANSLAEMVHRTWDHERQRKGESLRDGFLQARRTTISAVSGAKANAPRTFDA